MEVFHSVLPLTSNGRVKGAILNDVINKNFSELINYIVKSLNGNNLEPLIWDFNYYNITSIFRNRNTNKVLNTIKERSFFFKRLKSNMKKCLKFQILNRSLLKFKEIINTCDGIMISILFSFPEILGNDYKVSDQINNCLLSNCLLNHDLVLKSIKTFRKRMFKCAFEKVKFSWDGIENIQRTFSFLQKIVNLYNSEFFDKNSKNKMWRIGMFCQTRACGLPSSSIINDSFKKFKELTSKKREFNPSEELKLVIDNVITKLCDVKNSTFRRFRTSISNSGCVEKPKSKGGQFSFLTDFFSKSGIVMPENFLDFQGGEIGSLLFHTGTSLFKQGYPNMYKGNLAKIRENGKIRILISQSFWLLMVCQPFAHLLIEILKNEKALRGGFTASRLGYKALYDVIHFDPVMGEPLFDECVTIFNYDWVTATDTPSFECGRLLLYKTLVKLGLKDYYLNMLLDLVLQETKVYENKNYIFTMVNGWPMGRPITKYLLSIIHIICREYANSKVSGLHVIVHGNGDDGFVIIGHRKDQKELAISYINEYKKCAEILGFEFSNEDTFVTDDWCTFCGEIFMFPLNRFFVLSNAERIKDKNYSPYLDITPIKVLIDTVKDRKDFSTDISGKITVLGSNLGYTSRHKPNSGPINDNIYNLMTIQSSIQDICLNVKKYNIPLYLPKNIYGVGKVPSWDPKCWLNGIKSLKRNSQRIIFRTMRELLNKDEPLLINHRGLLTESIHFNDDTILTVHMLPEDSKFNEFIMVKRSDWCKYPYGVLQKLINIGELTTEREISKYYMLYERFKLGQPVRENLFDVLKRTVITLPDYSPEEEELTVKEFSCKFRNMEYLLNGVHLENLYSKELIQILADKDPLKVNIDWDFVKEIKSDRFTDHYHLRNDRDLAEWFYENSASINNGYDYPLPPDKTISSDEIIELEVHRSQELVIIIVTNDKALHRKLHNLFENKILIRINTETWINFEADEEKAISAFINYFPSTKGSIKIIIDEGSYNTILNNLGVPKSGPPKWNDSFKRGDVIYQEDLLFDMPPPLTFEDQNLFKELFLFFKQDFEKLRMTNNHSENSSLIKGLDGLSFKTPSRFEGI